MVELLEYQRFVEYTTSRESKGISEFIDRIVTVDANVPLLLTASVGLASESGEFSEIVKKVIFQGKELNVDVRYHMLRELGDICLLALVACWPCVSSVLLNIAEDHFSGGRPQNLGTGALGLLEAPTLEWDGAS